MNKKVLQTLVRLSYLCLMLFVITGTSISNAESYESPVPAKEDFKSFAKKFFSSKDFQFERITFPLLYTSWEPETGKIDSSFLSKEEWAFNEGKKGIVEKTKIKIIKKKNLVEYHIIGVNCGISLFYVFELKEGKYFMTSFNGRSD